MWDCLQKRFGPHLHTLMQGLRGLQQDELSIGDYYNAFDGFMEPILFMVSSSTADCQGCSKKTKFIQQFLMYQFVMGLRSEFEPVCAQLLNTSPAPHISDVLASLTAEETRLRSLSSASSLVIAPHSGVLAADLKDNNGEHMIFTAIKARSNDSAISIVGQDGDSLLAKCENKTPLYLCVELDNETLLQEWKTTSKSHLVQTVDIPGPKGTPLCLALEKGHEKGEKLVKFLIDLGADLNMKNNQGHAPLHLTAMMNNLSLMETLLNSGAAIDIRNKNNRTPLHLSLKHGACDCAKMLLKSRANFSLKDDNNDNAFNFAARAAVNFPENLPLIAEMLRLPTYDRAFLDRNYSQQWNLQDFVRRLPQDQIPDGLKKALQDNRIEIESDVASLPTMEDVGADYQVHETARKLADALTGGRLIDAKWAGGPNWKQYTLIITEGTSAKNFVKYGIETVLGEDKYGTLAMMGKPPNLNAEKVGYSTHEAVSDIFSALGYVVCTKLLLTSGEQRYRYLLGSKGLRYGHVLLLTDPDYDGSHIKGLIINIFYQYCPELLQIPDFLQDLSTAIFRETSDVKSFKRLKDYEAWENTIATSEWKIQYIKGVASNFKEDVPKYFQNLNEHVRRFVWSGKIDANFLNLTFGQAAHAAHGRKLWLEYEQVQGDDGSDYSSGAITISAFLRTELNLYYTHCNERSFPSIMDGLKLSQRKMMYFLLEIDDEPEEMKSIALIVGLVVKHSFYYHRHQNLEAAIARMASKWTINLIQETGFEETSTPYLETKLEKVSHLIFKAEDNVILKRINHRGRNVEPFWYAPIIPLVLINGCEGTGAAYKIVIPPIEPSLVISNLKRLMNHDRELVTMESKTVTFPIFLLNAEGHLDSYVSLEGVLIDFYEKRLELYEQRKKYQEEVLGLKVKAAVEIWKDELKPLVDFYKWDNERNP